MSEEKFRWLCTSVVVGVLALTVGACEMYQSTIVADMVKGGADPVRAACAFSADKLRNPACNHYEEVRP